ncbi:MAG TPA: molybdopterin molybdotransferase MoeA [Bacteroidales bacterium]|nr:molybdopterin molybdotransferase MoeA [Bacteroidales bacterium]HPS62939.1 molybdopterin molybdotransferase MoeA [Bacteroidales bacterium]
MEEDLISFEAALEIVLKEASPVGAERVPLPDSVGRVLAGQVLSDMDMPPFDKSAVDGYAIHPDDSNNPGDTNPLKVTETIAAGTAPQFELTPGHCARIMTGAMIPTGTGRVVMVEDSLTLPDGRVLIRDAGKASNICVRGEDIRKGEQVLEKGTVITPAEVAVLATVGVTRPLVAALPRVGILSTGDELVEPAEKPEGALIRNSNASQLMAQGRSVPALTRYYGIIPDRGELLLNAITTALDENDVVLLTGGVSMGDFDLVPAVMAECGIRILFRKIAVQPGKPTVFGRKGDKIIFGLPGNPVSSFVLFEMMVRPFLLRKMGSLRPLPVLCLPMGTEFTRRNRARKGMIPVRLNEGKVYPVEYHGSAHINAYVFATGIMMMETGIATVKEGERVHVRLL